MPYDYSTLNDLQLDMLREIANIGTGNAATALSTMLMQPVKIQVPQVSFLDYQAVCDRMGGPEIVMVGMMQTIGHDLSGMMMFLMKQEFAHMALNTLMGRNFADFAEVDELGMSAVQEIGNIMASSYVNAISQITGLTIEISPTDINVDMIGAMLSVPAIHFADISDKVICIENEFGGKNESSSILVIPSKDSLTLILEKLGAKL